MEDRRNSTNQLAHVKICVGSVDKIIRGHLHELDWVPRPLHTHTMIGQMGFITFGCVTGNSIIHENTIIIWEPLTELEKTTYISDVMLSNLM